MNIQIDTLARLFGAASTALALCVISPVASAGPILADDGVVYIEGAPSPLGTTPVADPSGNPVGLINYNGGQILLQDYASQPLTTYVPPAPSWWNAPGVAYTTTTGGILIDFVDLNVTGFTFNIGANMNANAWIKAYYDDGAGHELSTSWFGGIGPSSTPSFGVYVHDPAGSCAQITRIEIDPPLTFEWGTGNFGIAESSCASVPAPASGTLLSMGLLAMGMSHMLWLNRNRRLRVVASAN